MAKTVKSKPVFTEEELCTKHIGEYIDTKAISEADMNKWRNKSKTYEAEGVLMNYRSLVASFRPHYLDYRGFPCDSKADEVGQIMMDRWLHLRLKDEKIGMPPKAVVLVEAIAAGEESVTLNKADWDGKKSISENQLIRWVFENMEIAGLKPADSPSSGAWSLLTDLRKNKQRKADFYKATWPKLLTKEDGEKGNRLQDTGKTAIELNERLIAALPEDPERGLLQEIQANGFVVSEEIAERIEGLKL